VPPISSLKGPLQTQNRRAHECAAETPVDRDRAQIGFALARVKALRLKGHNVHQAKIHRLFQLSIAVTGLHGLVEIIGGIALFLFSTDAILRLMYRIDKHDAFARFFTPNEHR
jgi:hypothetical protein